ncbi:MAG: hypothetical protein CM15mP83_8830 [Flavobacteriaceae bacterium]|nr:MAG: hypothetical protein CM15mP83_8830 [Flavobacteriaceae bacterium]
MTFSEFGEQLFPKGSKEQIMVQLHLYSSLGTDQYRNPGGKPCDPKRSAMGRQPRISFIIDRYMLQ